MTKEYIKKLINNILSCILLHFNYSYNRKYDFIYYLYKYKIMYLLNCRILYKVFFFNQLFVFIALVIYNLAKDWVENLAISSAYASTWVAINIGGNLGGTGNALNILVMSSSGNGGSSFAARAWFSKACLK